MAAALLAFALPGRGADAEVFVELYVHPLTARPARAGGVAGFISEENAAALQQHLLGTQPLVASTVSFVLSNEEAVDSPLACAPSPGAILPPTRARIIATREPQGISLSGSVIMQLSGSLHPYLRTFSVRLPGGLRSTYCVRGMFFPTSDQVLEALVLLYVRPSGEARPAPRKQTPPLPLEPDESGVERISAEPAYSW